MKKSSNKINLIYGKNVVENVIINFHNQIKEVYILKGYAFSQEAYSIIKKYNIKWTSCEKETFSKFIQEKVTHQGIIAEVKQFQYSKLDDIIDYSNTQQTILILDRIQDPNNFGAIIRTSSLFDVTGIIILDHNQVDVIPTVVKASAGAIYCTPIVKVSNISNVINVLKEKGYWIYCSLLTEESISINELKFDKKTAIVLGSEGEGVLKKNASHSDFCFKIPTSNKINSLNVSVAAGIILYERSKQN